MQHTQHPITTGASVIGIKYKDGVMFASDTMVAYGGSLKFGGISRMHKMGQNTLVAASGEYSDFQYIKKRLSELELEDWQNQDNSRHAPSEVASWLRRIMYHRRTKVNPLWNQLLCGGVSNGKPTLHYIDLQGTFYEEDFIATGFGMHLAMPILRAGWRADLSESSARELLEQCLQLLFYRDCKASCNVQIATATETGVSIDKEKTLETFWGHSTWTKTAKEIDGVTDSW